MKRFFCSALFLSLCILINAQILDPLKWSFNVKETGENEQELVFTAKLDKGWHLYGQHIPENGPSSTTFTFSEIKGAELVGKVTPTREPIHKYDPNFEMELTWFENEISFIQKIKVTDPVFTITGDVNYMLCNDKNCLPPTSESFTFTGKRAQTTKSKTATPAIAETSEETTKTTEKADIKDTTTSPIDTSDVTNTVILKQNTDNDLWTPVIEELNAYEGNESHNSSSLFWIFLTGFGGGLLALVTPCVWPMIPMTVSFFLKRNKDRRKSIRAAMTYGLSIIVIYVLLGLIITILFGASALNDMATNAVFNIIFFALLVLFAVSFFGAFELTLPASWTTKLDSKADSTSGILSIFFMAFTLTLVSFSCTGPIIGTLLVEAASSGSITAPAIGMTGFAVALAIPFSLFAIFPSWLQSMPKSGGWLNSVKVVLGFLELALALKFLSVADLAYGWRILDREVFVSLWIVIFMLLGVYLLGKLKLPHDSDLKHISTPRLFLAIISFSFAVYMLPGLWGAPLKAISAFTPPLRTQDFNLYDQEVHAKYEDYDAGMAYAKEKGKPVMIDFSGYGCVNCRKMEAAVWSDPSVKSIIDNDYVLITLMVDDKTPLKEPIKVTENGKQRTLKTIGDKWSYLQRHKFGANAQPFYVLLDNEGEPLAGSYSYNENVPKYVQFLKSGLKSYKEKE
ncbi:protein-disulfide reductase DsbD family protein [Coprobacter tertius]|uniref:Thioredoxin family protein n=1 Tax=Coprobacter tertius TaxID=2944915 RepID=A0ABT1MFG7_9BACT|nr:cytochrome c biogenesis protein CcdA [Coprobacter tertius]MCP9610794.1 thioredoxin family protein [Coprobacter tertius]